MRFKPTLEDILIEKKIPRQQKDILPNDLAALCGTGYQLSPAP